jgi:hypothetical protein
MDKMTILELANNRIAGLKRKTAKEWAGPCPECGGTDRFLVWTDRDAWYCRGCDKGGDAIEFLRRFDNLSCPDAHEALGKACDSSSCQVREKCRLGDGSGKTVRRDTLRATPAVKAEQGRDFTPAAATQPAEQWAQKAQALTDWAHQQLLGNQDQLNFLAARGLPLGAVQQFRLGWVPQDLFRQSAAWGIDAALSEKTRQPKKLYIPQGILIPFFTGEQIHRIRIRRHKIQGDQPRYHWLPGSGNDVVLINPIARAFVVVESDLDGLAIVHAAADLVGAVPLGTCSAKPKEAAYDTLRSALSLLVALDFDKPDSQGRRAGASAWTWWRDHFARADRWPVPAGKDPGDYVKDHGGDLRAWVGAGLRQCCPALILQAAQPAAQPIQKTAAIAPSPAPAAEAHLPAHSKGRSHGGHDYVIAHHVDHVARLVEHYPEVPVFTPAEIEALRGLPREAAELALLSKVAFGAGTEVLGTQPVAEEPPAKQGHRNWWDKGGVAQHPRRGHPCA